MSIFNFVIDEVHDVTSRIVSEVNKVQELRDSVESAVNGMVGNTWTGAGANAFHSEVATRLLPEIAALIESIGGFQTNLTKAQDRVVQGDDEACKAIDHLTDLYQQINI